MRPFLLALLVFVCACAVQTSPALEPSELISEVIPIKYARAADLATVLLKMTTNGVAVAPPATTKSASRSSATPRSRTVRADTLQYTGMPSIIADERTNSLLIHATREDMRRFKEAIAQLDIAATQILIEAAIIELEGSGSNDPALGLAQGKTPGLGNGGIGAGLLTRSNMLRLSDSVPLIDPNAAATGPHGFGYLAKPNMDFDSLVSHIAGDSRVKILQRPRIQTSDGVRASLFVGETRPYSGGSGPENSATTSDPSAQPLQIGVTFEVTPVIKPDGCVVMDIHQKINRLVGTVNIANVGEVPVTSSTEAQAEVAARDRETVLLGGLREASEPNNPGGSSRPKDLYLPGAAVSRSSASAAPKEIIALIRPTVLPKSEAAAEH